MPKNIREPGIDALRTAPVYFRYGSNRRLVLVDALTASAIIAVHDAANANNQAKLGRMVSGSVEQLLRVQSFAFKHTSIGR